MVRLKKPLGQSPQDKQYECDHTGQEPTRIYRHRLHGQADREEVARIRFQADRLRAAYEVNAMQTKEGAEQEFSAVILQMEKQAGLGNTEKKRARAGKATAEK